MAFNGPINESHPLPEHAKAATVSRGQKGFIVNARKLPISKSEPIEDMHKKLRIPPPEMIFGDNMVSITHENSGWEIQFNSFDALDRVDKTDKNMLKVAYSREWSQSRETHAEGIKEVVKPFDWSYTTDYKGTVQGPAFTPDTEPIPIELLKRPDPILFFEEVVLYESELDDNGISVLSIKVRVMPDRMLLLCRLFMRLDNVIFRIRDTRVYVDFTTAKVTREYTAKEEEFSKVNSSLLREGRHPDEITVAMRDPNQIINCLRTVDQSMESVTLK